MQAESENSEIVPQETPTGQPQNQPEPRPISELVDLDDFPRCALGQWVNIGGYTGEVTDIVSHSLKVRSSEGHTMSFNVGGLRRIYGKPVPPPPIPPVASRTPEPAPPPPPVFTAEPTVQPDFSKPVRSIRDYVTRPDYPQCLLGEHIEVAGYSGVVVQIVHRSLKVRSPAEVTRSYNADALRRLYA